MVHTSPSGSFSRASAESPCVFSTTSPAAAAAASAASFSCSIIFSSFFGSTRFAEFEQGLGIAKNILSDRLQKLVRHGILERSEEEGRRPEYRLTRKGRDLWLVLTALRLWSDKWVFGRGNEPYVARDRDSGRALRGLLAVDDRGEPLDPRNLRWHRGPG